MAETASILNSPHLWSCLNMKFELTNIFKNLFHQTQDKERAASGNWVLWKHESSNKRLYTFKGSLLEAMLCIHSSLWTSNYHHALCSRFSNRSLAQANTCHAMSLRRLVGTWWDHLPTSLFLLAKTDRYLLCLRTCLRSVFASRASICLSFACVRRGEKKELSLTTAGIHWYWSYRPTLV